MPEGVVRMDRPRLLAVGGPPLREAVGALPHVTFDHAEDFGRALDLLMSGVHDLALVHHDLGGGGLAGTDLIREAVGRHSPVPLILATAGPLESAQQAALEAGAVGCVDLSRPDDVRWCVAFAYAGRIAADQRNARLLKDVSSFLAHEGKNVLAAIGGAVEVLSHGMPPASPDRAICVEIRERLGSFRDTIEAMTLAVRVRVPVRETTLPAATPRPTNGDDRRPPRPGRPRRSRPPGGE
jgi:CheY-like chemotaxis protein